MSISAYAFLRRLEQGFLPKIVLFQGEEDYWVSQGILEVRKRLFSHEEAEFNLVELEARSLEPGVLKTTLLTLPFLSPTRLVILTGLEEIKANADTELIKGLDQIAEGIYVLISARKVDQRKKVFKELSKRATVVDCNPLKVYEAKKWLVEEGKRLGLKVPSVISDLLIERRGTSLKVLYNELEKALIYQGASKSISVEEWVDLIGGSAESNIFALIDYTSEGNPRAAMEVLNHLLTNGEPEMKILFMLGRQIRQLFQAWLFLQEGRGKEALQQEVRCHPFVAEKLVTQARILSYRQLRATLNRILKADYKIKSGHSEPQLELEMVVLDLTSILSDTCA